VASVADDDAPGECPDEDQISAYVGQCLEPAARAEVEAHLDVCEACSLLVADLVRIYADDPSGPSMLSSGSLTRTEGAAVQTREGPELLAPGSAIGRYRTLECVGIGGMGVVYSAYDPQLDRRVALKLLLDSDEKNRDRKRARLLREAQSMAKLTHPNVITVHDVGVWHGQVFVAMEFVEGGTLKSWMRERQRSWSEIRDTVLAAGRGLAAAHAAGLVHRDFKPDNVLIGHDGQVRVTDFGLARWEDGASSTGQKILSGSDASLSFDGEDEALLSAEVSLTRTGALVGTPAYMAPELYAHEVADASTDQFAFCVALYEALYGVRPFKGQTLAELATNVVSGDAIEFSGAVSVPRHVRNALRRGLSRRRRDRFPSMHALLAALSHRVARGWQTAAVVGVPLCVVGLGAWASLQSPTAEVRCSDAAAPIEEVWNDARRTRIDTAFRAAPSPLAERARRTLLADVDAFVRDWSATAGATCEVQAAGGRDTFVALSELCLARNRIALDVALDGFDDVDDGDVARASSIVGALERDCGDEASLLSEAPPPAPADLEAEAKALRLDLARVDGFEVSGEYAAGVELARELDGRATALGHRPLQAETKVALAGLLDLSGDYETAATVFEEAELLATASRYHRVTAEALTRSVYVHGVLLQQHEHGRRLARRAEAAGEAAGLGDEFRSALLLNLASLEFSAAEFDAAEGHALQALGLRDRDANPMRWADAAFNVASIRIVMGRGTEAIGTLEAYIDVFEREVGHLHPDVAVGYHTLGVVLLESGRRAEGEKALRTALDILEKTVGEEHPLYANPLSDLADVEAARENYPEAIALARKALALRESHGSEPLSAAENRLHIAEWLIENDELDAAEKALGRAFEQAIEAVGDEHPRMGGFWSVQAFLEAARGNRKAAEAAKARAGELLGAAFEDDSEAMLNHHLAWAGMLRIMGDHDGAIEALRTLLAGVSGEQGTKPIAVARFELAKLLEQKSAGSVEARTLADASARRLREIGQIDAAAEVTRWLDAH